MSLDPWRTLGLPPGSSDAEIKRAYRRLAKEHHPDAGGAGALPRFLAIQSAYELLTSGRVRGAAHRSGAGYGGRRGHGGASPGGEPWRADPTRARATREAWGRPGAGASSQRAGSTNGEPREQAGQRSGAHARPNESRRSGAGAQARAARVRKATPGSTSYDDARHEPEEPGWTGSSWYGQTSGTYWTINPREYADPRKHGPDYQARARRVARPVGPAEDPGVAATPGPAPRASAAAGPAHDQPAEGARHAAGPAHDQPAVTLPWPAALARWVLTTPDRPPIRVGLALLAWPPPAVAGLMVAGQLTGCARYAASCPGPEVFIGWWIAVQLVILAALLALPTLARVGAVGGLASLAAAVPAAVVLTAVGASYAPEGGAGALLAILGSAYLAGMGYGWRIRRDLRSGTA